MSRSISCRLIAASLLALAGCGHETEHAYRTIVLVSLDTVRADHLGCYGNPSVRTPHLDALAREGVRFEHAMTAAPTTLASHLSIFTGVYPHSHGVARNGFTVAPQNETLAEVLRAAGYRTAAFLGSFALDKRFGIDQGFEHYDQRFDVGIDGTHEQEQRRASAVTDAALGWLQREQPGDSFLFVHYFDAHAPYEPPPPFDSMYARAGGPKQATLNDVDAAVRAQQKRACGKEAGAQAVIQKGLTRELVERADGHALPADVDLAALYAGEVSYVDQELGRLLEGLRRDGRLENALVVVLSDHGETFAEHGDFWNHGLWVHETSVHVPLIVRSFTTGASALAARAVAEPVSTIDVLPTICELAGVAAPKAVEGRSLAAWLGRNGAVTPATSRGPIFCEATQPPACERAPWPNDLKPKCVRVGECKYVDAPYLALQQLFDLSKDPGERTNLLATPGACDPKELARLLAAWRALAKPFPSRFDPAQTLETQRKLRGLGYSEGDAAPDGAEGH